MVPSIQPQLPNVVAAAAAASALFKPGQVLEALVMGKAPDGTVALKIGEMVITAQLPQALPPGTTLQLQVKTGGPSPQLVMVGTPQLPAAALPVPAAPVMPLPPLVVMAAAEGRAATAGQGGQVPPTAPLPAPAPPHATPMAQQLPAAVAPPASSPALATGPVVPPAAASPAVTPSPTPMAPVVSTPVMRSATAPQAQPSAPPQPAAPTSAPQIAESPQVVAAGSSRIDSGPARPSAPPPPAPVGAAQSPVPTPIGTTPVAPAPTTSAPAAPPPAVRAPTASPPPASPVPPPAMVTMPAPVVAEAARPSPVATLAAPPAQPAAVAAAASSAPSPATVQSPPPSTPLPAPATAPVVGTPQTAATGAPGPQSLPSAALMPTAPAAVQSAVVAGAPSATPLPSLSPPTEPVIAPAPAASQPVARPLATPTPVVAAAVPEPAASSPLLVAQGAVRPPPTASDLPKPAPLVIAAVQTQAPPLPATPAAALTQMMPEAMARQNSIAPLLASLAAVAAKPGVLPEPVLRAALQVLGGRVQVPATGPTAQILEAAVAKSGVYLEAGLARGAPAADLKSGLVALRGALAAWLGGNPAPVTATQQAAPPLRGMPPRADALDLPPLPDAPREAGRVLHSQADAALSRVKLMQLASLPDADPARAPAQELRMEVPFLVGQELVMAQFQVLRDGAHRKSEGKRGWTMRFAMNFAATGEVGAEVGLLGRAVNVALWAADPETAAGLEAALPELAPALAALGLEPGAVRVRSLPPETPKPASGQYLDSRR